MNPHDNRTPGRPSVRALRAVAAAAVIASIGVPVDVQAMGLGRLVVQSALGEPLRAEIEVSAITAEEAASLRSRVAAPEAFRAAGAEFNAALTGATVSLQRRADGRSVLRLVSERAVNEPFIDVILEVEWSSGRLSREFTMLFDPPLTQAVASAQVPVAVAPAPLPAPTPAASVPRAQGASAPSLPASAPMAVAKPSVAKAPAGAASRPEAAAPAGSTDYRVQPGDTLSRIASRNLRPGVSLDQMLVSLYRGNAGAFVDENMNLLKVGSVLRMPSGESAAAIPPAEARQVIRAQSADFGAYRSRLAGSTTAAAPTSGRSAAGQVEVSVQDRKTAASAASDRLTLSKGPAGNGKAEESVAKAREKDDSAARVAELARNVEDLKKLKGVTAGGVAIAPSAPAASAAPGLALPSSPAVPLPSSTAAPTAPAASAAASAPTTAAPSASEASAPAPAAAVQPAKAPAPAVTPPPAPPGESGDFFGDLLDNPLLLPAGGALAALLGLLGWQRMRRRRRQGGSETSFLESRLQPDSFFGVSGGQRVDTRDDSGAPSSMSFSLSQLDAIGDVDPVAEADVYLAYGRDLQAEEILKEAIKVAPDRMAIRVKLLEVYAKRRDVKSCEAVASEIHALTGGEGEDWAKVQQMGAELEPENQLYQPGGKPVARPAPSAPIPSRDGDTVQLPNRPGRSRFDEEAARPVSATLAPGAVGAAAAAAAKDSGLPPLSSFGSAEAVPARAPVPSQATAAASPPPGAGTDLDLDFNLDAPQAAGLPSLSATASPAAPGPQPSVAEPSLDFSLPAMSMDFPAPATAPAVAASEPEPLQPLELGGDLLDLDAPAPIPVAAATPEPEPLDFSLDTQPAPLDVGLDMTLDEAAASPLDAASAEALERKLELADEFRQIGDVEGARELLQEVISQSQGGLKGKAEAMLRGLI